MGHDVCECGNCGARSARRNEKTAHRQTYAASARFYGCRACLHPLAVRLVWETFEAMRSLPPHERVPIVAVGGIEKWEDAVEFIMAGALAVGVGTNTFANPLTMLEVLAGIEAFMKRKGFASVYDMCGIAHGD